MKGIVIGVVVLCTFLLGIFRPFYNHDLVDYVAAAFQKDGLQDKALSDRTYETIKIHASEKRFADLTNGKMEEVKRDPQILEDNQPFYSVKSGYIFLIHMVSHLFGMDYVLAIIGLSAVFAAFSSLILGFVLLKENIAIYFLPIIMLTAGYLDLTSLATPDAIACFLVLGALYFIENDLFLVPMLLLIPFFRPDCLIFTFLLMVYLVWRGRKNVAILCGLFSLAIYYFEVRTSGNYGWATFFYINFIPHEGFPTKVAINSLRPLVYMKIYAIKFYDIFSGGDLSLFLLSLCLLFARVKKIDRFDCLYLLIPVAYVLVHLVYFPHFEQRYFSFAESLVFIWAIKTISGNNLIKRATN